MDTFINYISLDECKKLSLVQKNKEVAKKWHDMAPTEKEKFKHSAQSFGA